MSKLGSFEDTRGKINDVSDSVFYTTISNLKGAVRGNHYHANTDQWTLVRQGMLRIVKQMPGGELRQFHLQQGEYDYSPATERHAWEAVEYTIVDVFTLGPRAGVGFELDTIRLKEGEKLI